MTEIEFKQLHKISSQFLKDLEFLEKAYEFTVNGTSTFLEVATDDHLLHDVTLDYAAWVFCEFNQDKEKYYSFLDNYFKNRKVSGNTLFGLRFPDAESPNEEANRILDRIDIALNFFKTNFDMELPYELKGQNRNEKHSIRNGGWNQDKLLKRVKSFAKSAYDLFYLENSD
jgi:hypothetical protein